MKDFQVVWKVVPNDVLSTGIKKQKMGGKLDR